MSCKKSARLCTGKLVHRLHRAENLTAKLQADLLLVAVKKVL
jgi:hypothetical protein